MIPCPTEDIVALPNNGMRIATYREHIKPAVLVPETANAYVTVAAASAGGCPGRGQEILIDGPEDGHCDILRLVGKEPTGQSSDVTARALVVIEDAARRRLSNLPVPVHHTFGTQLNPFYFDRWSDCPILQPNESWHFCFTNPSATDVYYFYPSIGARKIQRRAMNAPEYAKDLAACRQRKAKVIPWWWAPSEQTISQMQPGLTLAASGRGTLVYHNYSDRWLALTCCMMTCISSGQAGDTQEYVEFEVFTPPGDAAIQDRPVTWGLAAGASTWPAAFPFPFATPLIVPPNEQVIVRLRNLITDASTDVLLTFCGLALLV